MRRLRPDRAELVPLFRREPLHERLAREGGLDPRPLPEAGPPGWMETGIHGVPRHREWDAARSRANHGDDGCADQSLSDSEG